MNSCIALRELQNAKASGTKYGDIAAFSSLPCDATLASSDSTSDWIINKNKILSIKCYANNCIQKASPLISFAPSFS